MSARSLRLALLAGATALGLVVVPIGGSPAVAVGAPVALGTAASYAVLAGSTVTNTGLTALVGDVGLSPGTSITGFPPGLASGTIRAADAAAAQAKIDTTTAYNDAAGRGPATAIAADLGGMTLVSGVYSGGALGLTGTLTLDGQGDATAVFVLQAASTLTTASGSVVALIGSASPCNVYWQVGSSATLGTSSTFVGTVLAYTSITATTGATITGRLLARNGAVTLAFNAINNLCAAATPTTTTTSTPAPATTTTTWTPVTTTTTRPDRTTTTRSATTSTTATPWPTTTSTTPTPTAATTTTTSATATTSASSTTTSTIADETTGATTSVPPIAPANEVAGAEGEAPSEVNPSTTPQLPRTGSNARVFLIGLFVVALGTVIALVARRRGWAKVQH